MFIYKLTMDYYILCVYVCIGVIMWKIILENREPNFICPQKTLSSGSDLRFAKLNFFICKLLQLKSLTNTFN